MPTLVSPDQRLQLNAALAVIQWKHAFAVKMQQRTGTPAKSDYRISDPRIPSTASKKVLSTH
jgi:hypothetical protein